MPTQAWPGPLALGLPKNFPKEMTQDELEAVREVMESSEGERDELDKIMLLDEERMGTLKRMIKDKYEEKRMETRGSYAKRVDVALDDIGRFRVGMSQRR